MYRCLYIDQKTHTQDGEDVEESGLKAPVRLPELKRIDLIGDTYICLYIDTYIDMCIHVYLYIYIYIHTHAHTHTHTHTRTHTHTHTQGSPAAA